MDNKTSHSRSEDRLAEECAKLAALVWVLFGIYSIFTHKVEGNFFSFFIFLTLYSFGLGLASIAAILSYLPTLILTSLSNKYNSGLLKIVAVISIPISMILTIVWIIFLANLAIGWNNSFFISPSTQTQISVPIEYKNDNIALQDSIAAIGESKELTLPKNGIVGAINKDNGKKADSLVEKAILLSDNVSDKYLDYIHPEFKNIYRNKIIKGAELILEGRRTDNVQLQLKGAALDEEWRNWFDNHKDDLDKKVF